MKLGSIHHNKQADWLAKIHKTTIRLWYLRRYVDTSNQHQHRHYDHHHTITLIAGTFSSQAPAPSLHTELMRARGDEGWQSRNGIRIYCSPSVAWEGGGFVAFNKLVLNTTSAVSRKKPRVVRCSRMKQNSVPRTLIHIVCDLNLLNPEHLMLDICWEFVYNKCRYWLSKH